MPVVSCSRPARVGPEARETLTPSYPADLPGLGAVGERDIYAELTEPSAGDCKFQ